MFLPQRSYIPEGTLKDALCYPEQGNKFSDQACIDALIQVNLGHLATRLSQTDRWQQKLSGGEQQRLAFARVLLQKPDFLFLDEATSAIDPATERKLYLALLAQLPDITLVSVAHREALVQFHQHFLDLSPSDEVTL